MFKGLKKLVLLSFLLVFVVSMVHTAHASEVYSGGEVIVSPMTYDFGDVYPEKGLVSTTFTVENVGSEVLKINKLSTSCGCTVAKMDLSDMPPSSKREMIVTFDPNAHADDSGEIVRAVYLKTSDPANAEVAIELVGNVIREVSGKDGKDGGDKNQGFKDKSVVVFFNEACKDCGELVMEKYPVFFKEYGFSVENKDYINEKENRKILNEYNEKWEVPFDLQSHIEAFVDDKLLIGGHVPEGVMRYLLEHPDEYERILVYQDDMHGSAENYKVWDFKGEVKSYPIDEPITTYLDWHKTSGGDSILSAPSGFWGFFALITSSAFLDGINPCAIAVLLFFIAFLFSIKSTKRSIWKVSLVYIFAIYLAYFLIGIGIAQAIVISGAPHLMAFIGSYLVIGLGIIQLLGIVFPRFPIRLRIPLNTKAVLEKWLYKATVPAAFIGGFIVGLCTFPCSGGIYVAVIGLLATSQTYLQGLWWMIWYNFVFISPLLIILALAGNEKATEKLQNWERKESKMAKIIIGLTMIALGVIILKFFT
ncbi:MAG: DUF1573 domain-containing protein [Patescibacteria group bacterium]